MSESADVAVALGASRCGECHCLLPGKPPDDRQHSKRIPFPSTLNLAGRLPKIVPDSLRVWRSYDGVFMALCDTCKLALKWKIVDV